MTNLGRVAKDEAVVAVAQEIHALDPNGDRAASVFRDTFDQIYDGQRTGRYRIDQLAKTEKTHFGTLIEINLQREFGFRDGDVLDFNIAGHEVDSKYSHTGKWMLPPESFDRIILVARADDADACWSLGAVRVSEENRRKGSNRDGKVQLSPQGVSDILWIFQDAPMPPNALLQLPRAVVDEIMAPASGQTRVNELFRHATNQRLTRNIVATVAQQKDYMKRVRYNGGARSDLRSEGFLILSGDYQQQRELALALGATAPEKGELVSVQVVPSSDTKGVEIDGSWWRLARLGDEVSHPAPVVKDSARA